MQRASDAEQPNPVLNATNPQFIPQLADALSKGNYLRMFEATTEPFLAPTAEPASEPSPATTPTPAPVSSPTINPSVIFNDKHTFNCNIYNVTCDTQHMLDVNLGGAKYGNRARLRGDLSDILQPPNDTLIAQNEQGWQQKLFPTTIMKTITEIIKLIRSIRHNRALSTFTATISHNFPIAGNHNKNVASTATRAPAQPS